MMPSLRLSVFVGTCAFAHSAYADTIKKVYLDRNQNVHIISSRGHDSKITRTGNAGSLKLAPDGETVAWLILNTWTADGDDGPGSEELVVYRDGKSNSIKCTPFIRDYWFWMSGNQVAIDCGGRHFAGHEILYDSRTMRELSSFDEAKVPLEKRPDWSNGDN